MLDVAVDLCPDCPVDQILKDFRDIPTVPDDSAWNHTLHLNISK